MRGSKPPYAKPDGLDDRIRDLYRQGYNSETIALWLKLTRQTVLRRLHRMKEPLRPPRYGAYKKRMPPPEPPPPKPEWALVNYHRVAGRSVKQIADLTGAPEDLIVRMIDEHDPGWRAFGISTN